MKKYVRFFIPLVFLAVYALCLAAQESASISFLSQANDGSLVYGTDAEGNRIPDFSHCGYKGGNSPIPDVPIRAVLSPVEGDNTQRIQAAIDYVGKLPLDSEGFRGAVLLRSGRYPIFGGLILSASGVVLRGEGMEEEGTVLIAAGTDRRTLIRIAGREDRVLLDDAPRKIVDAIAPVGAVRFHLDNTEGLKAGDTVQIIRPSTKEWIERLGMNRFGGGLKGIFDWKPGSRDLLWDRVVQSVSGNCVTVDAPITAAIDASFGGGAAVRYFWPGRIRCTGVENLRCRSESNAENPKDEEHAWTVVAFENVENAWIRRVTAEGFAGSLAAVWESGKWIAVEDCISLRPVSEHGGYRRDTFFTMGQMTLFLRCWAEEGRHDFTAGHCAAGPNAFVQCYAHRPLEDSGPIESWACGTLYDNVRIDGNALRLCNRGSRGEGIGWAAANSVLWQCDAATLECGRPPTAWNWAFGSWGEFEGDGYWEKSNSFVKPQSLYAAQIADRLGREAAKRIELLQITGSNSTSPTIEQAEKLAEASCRPMLQLADFIRQAPQRHNIPTDCTEAKTIDQILKESPSLLRRKTPTRAEKPVYLRNGRLVCENRLLSGQSTGMVWWRGSIRPQEAASFGPALTRFVPGRTGTGYTDDLDQVIDWMVGSSITALEHHYGLWYDRRRDDHQRVRRMNGDVRPPFYEQPFARSGIGQAWDGLSRYDLTKYNPWYWNRLNEFAERCDQKGLVLLHQHYFQHNILEAGAHWADFPWRSANNINETGFPEPPPYAGDKRIYMDHLFYDAADASRRPLHEAYIRKCLDNFLARSNVIHSVGAEYTGPLEFVQFWLDTIDRWKRETGKSPLIALSCTKDVQDAILSDPMRSRTVSLIDIRYWWIQANGIVYAPEGGKHLAPRQHARQQNPKPASFEQVVRAIREYRKKYPDKAAIYSADSKYGWAVLLGGGSLPNLPVSTDPTLLEAAPRMEIFENSGDCWALAEPGIQYLVYAPSGRPTRLDLSGTEGIFDVSRIDLSTGQAFFGGQTVKGRAMAEIQASDLPALLWLKRK